MSGAVVFRTLAAVAETVDCGLSTDNTALFVGQN
jgi:hypothetical protein